VGGSVAFCYDPALGGRGSPACSVILSAFGLDLLSPFALLVRPFPLLMTLGWAHFAFG
jgi:hypothetical protein